MDKLLRRKIDAYLSEWKNNPSRKPLIVKGARQIGKTLSIEHFAKRNYKSFEERAEKARAILAETGITMALREKWNPKGTKRIPDLINHYKRFATREGIRQLLNLDEN